MTEDRSGCGPTRLVGAEPLLLDRLGEMLQLLDFLGDLELLIESLLPQIVGHDVPGQVAKAGRITDLHPAPAGVAELKETFK